MGWFKENKKEVSRSSNIPSLDEPSMLPELPKLPPLPNSFDSNFENRYQEKMQPLPSLPSNSLGNKFSQDMIKEAVEENDNEEYEHYPQKSFRQSMVNEMPEEAPYEFREAAKRVKKLEPIFVRLDKFEASLENFELMKKKISEIKTLLRDIKEKKAQEEQQLAKWESELQLLKTQLDKIDTDLFSKIE